MSRSFASINFIFTILIAASGLISACDTPQPIADHCKKEFPREMMAEACELGAHFADQAREADRAFGECGEVLNSIMEGKRPPIYLMSDYTYAMVEAYMNKFGGLEDLILESEAIEYACNRGAADYLKHFQGPPIQDAGLEYGAPESQL